MQKRLSLRLNDPEIIEWLESRQSVSDTAREALIRMKQGEELSADLIERLNGLAGVTERLDKRDKQVHTLLQRLLDKLG